MCPAARGCFPVGIYLCMRVCMCVYMYICGRLQVATLHEPKTLNVFFCFLLHKYLDHGSCAGNLFTIKNSSCVCKAVVDVTRLACSMTASTFRRKTWGP